VHKIEADSVKTESELVAGLYKKGLAVASRKLALERGVAQVDGDRLRLESSLMRARQEVSKTKISLIDLQAKRSSDISSEMQKSQGRLEELQSRSETARNLLFETENLAPQLLASQEKAEDLQPRFKIMRGGETLTISGIVEATSIEPGDTLVVEAPARRSVSKSLDPDASTASSAAQALADRLR
jgi:hypothetical protein